MKQVTTKTLATIADECNNVLDFLRVIADKSPRVTAAPLSLPMKKCAPRWTDTNLPMPPKPYPQDHMGLTDILTDVTTRFHTVEALRPIFVAWREVEKKSKGWDRLPSTAHCVILRASSTNRISIPTSPPPIIHHFLNARNTTALQANCSLT